MYDVPVWFLPTLSFLFRDMMTSSNGNIFRGTGHLCGEFTGTCEYPAQKPATWNFDVFFDLRQNKRLGKQSWGWLFETPSHPLWRHCNVTAFGADNQAPLRPSCRYLPVGIKLFKYNSIMQWTLDISRFLFCKIFITFKKKLRHFDEISVTACTGCCYFGSFQHNHWGTPIPRVQ